MLDSFMLQLCKEIELDPPLRSQLPGVYNYPLEEDLAFTITALSPFGFKLECTLGPCPKDRTEELFTEMLEGNLFGKTTFGSVLSLDEKGEKIMLCRVVDHKVDYREFRDTVEDFINVIDFWRKQARIIS